MLHTKEGEQYLQVVKVSQALRAMSLVCEAALTPPAYVGPSLGLGLPVAKQGSLPAAYPGR